MAAGWLCAGGVRSSELTRCMQVGVNYDPMIAKVIARGADRRSALQRLHSALSDLQVGPQAGSVPPTSS